MLVLILLYCTVFVAIYFGCKKITKNKGTRLAEGVVSIWAVIGFIIINTMFIGQGVAKIETADELVGSLDEDGVYQEATGEYYQIKPNLWRFWDIYDKDYLSDNEIENIERRCEP